MAAFLSVLSELCWAGEDEVVHELNEEKLQLTWCTVYVFTDLLRQKRQRECERRLFLTLGNQQCLCSVGLTDCSVTLPLTVISVT